MQELIEQLQKIGMNIICTVSDQGTTNVTYVKKVLTWETKVLNYYTDFVTEKPITHIFDIPHLLKYTRNALCYNNIR